MCRGNMSLYRCLSCLVRNRVVVEKLALPVLPLFNHAVKQSQNSVPNNSEVHCVPYIIDNHQVMCCRLYGDKAKKKKAPSSSSSDSSDSDTEKGTKKERRGQSAFWRQKMRTHHMVIDVNKDGVVSWDDFEVLIKNFTNLGNLKENEIQKFTDALKLVWEEGWGASGDPYAFIGFEHFLTNMEHVLNSKELRKKVAQPLPYFFDAVDYDSSGEISLDEFKTFYKCLNMSEEAATATFAVIDINEDGKLSRKEFVKLGKDFFLSEEENSPSKVFWGPLSTDR